MEGNAPCTLQSSLWYWECTWFIQMQSSVCMQDSGQLWAALICMEHDCVPSIVVQSSVALGTFGGCSKWPVISVANFDCYNFNPDCSETILQQTLVRALDSLD